MESTKYDNEAVKTYRIYLTAVIANISAFAVGNSMSWSSPILPKLKSPTLSDTPLSRPITESEGAWISSLVMLGGIITPFVAGPLADRFGRKKILLSSSIFFILSYIIILIANEVWTILVGRLIQGFGIGFVMCVCPMYVGEISNNESRGATGSLLSFFMIFGIYSMNCIGPFVSYMILQCYCLLAPIIFALIFFFLPESPYYLIANNQRTSASKALQFLRGQDEKTVESELVDIEHFVETSMAQKSGPLHIFRTIGNRKALLISLGLITLQQTSGVSVALFYTPLIFESADINLEPAIATIIVGSMQMIAAITSPFLIKYFGRKIILLYSAAIMSIGFAALGYFFFSQIVLGTTSGITWLPVVALVIYIMSYTVGFGPLPWAVLGEIFPSNIKAFAATLTSSMRNVAAFSVSLSYPPLAALGTYYAFWMFAIFCIIALLFVLFIVIETKDLSLETIQQKLNNKDF